MPNEPTLREQTRDIFKDTVKLYRKDLHSLLRKPLPLILAVAAIILFWVLIQWV